MVEGANSSQTCENDSWGICFRIVLCQRVNARAASLYPRMTSSKWIDERQITHLICACLKYDLYDFFRGVLGLLPVLSLV